MADFVSSNVNQLIFSFKDETGLLNIKTQTKNIIFNLKFYRINDISDLNLNVKETLFKH